MNADRMFDLLGKIVFVALVTTVLLRGTAAAKVVTSLGDAFSGSLRVAQGR